jgi:hypothetical protein
MKYLLTVAIMFGSVGLVFSQGTSKLDCELATLNLDSPNPDVIRTKLVRRFGRFKIDNPGEEERITKFFRLPNSNWFVVASLYSTDESMPSKSGADSLDMEMSLARKRRRNIFTSPVYAFAEFPYWTLDIGRVGMIVRVGKHRELVTMECIAVN